MPIPAECPSVVVDEHYMYNVELGETPMIIWKKGYGEIQVRIPYDGFKLANLPATNTTLPLGSIALGSPEPPQIPETFPVELKTGPHLLSFIKSGGRMLWERRYAVEEPKVLVEATAEIFDGVSRAQELLHHHLLWQRGAALLTIPAWLDLPVADSGSSPERLYDLVFEAPEPCADDLRLHLTLWVPPMLNQNHSHHEPELADLLKQENTEQVFVETLESPRDLAKHMAALANSQGGRILIGVRRGGHVVGLRGQDPAQQRAEVELALLKAALLCHPPVPFQAPVYLEHANGVVARVVVPKAEGVHYLLNRHLYRRRGLEEIDAGRTTHREVVGPRIGNIANTLATFPRENRIDLYANYAPEKLSLGQVICGVINTMQRDTLIVVYDFAPMSNRRSPAAAQDEMHHQFSTVVRQELARCTPRLQLPEIYFTVLNGVDLAIIHIPVGLALVALYEDEGYAWTNGWVEPLPRQTIFNQYLQKVGTYQNGHAAGSQVYLTYGGIKWSQQPPQPLTSSSVVSAPSGGGIYDIQRQALVWPAQEFKPLLDTVGLRCDLHTPLHRSLLHPTSSGAGSVSGDLHGMLRIRFDNVLASGRTVTISSQHPFFNDIPLYKRTHVHLDLSVNALELLHIRRRLSRLRFRLSNVLLSPWTFTVIEQTCVDVGFRLSRTDRAQLPERAMIEGLRSTQYCDIYLVLGLCCESASVTRETHVGRRRDRQLIDVGMLDVGAVLSGAGPDVVSEMQTLQLRLYHLMTERLGSVLVDERR